MEGMSSYDDIPYHVLVDHLFPFLNQPDRAWLSMADTRHCRMERCNPPTDDNGLPKPGAEFIVRANYAKTKARFRRDYLEPWVEMVAKWNRTSNNVLFDLIPLMTRALDEPTPFECRDTILRSDAWSRACAKRRDAEGHWSETHIAAITDPFSAFLLAL